MINFNKMKYLYITLFFLSFPLLGNSQSVFETFDNNEKVTTVSVSQSGFKLMARFAGDSPEEQEFSDMINNLSQLKMYVTDDADVANQMNQVAKDYVKKKKLVELMRVKEGDSNVIIYIREGENPDLVKEVLMFASEEEQSVVVSISGEIDLNQLAMLSEKMNLPTVPQNI